MLDRGSGKVINLASQVANVALLAHAAYCASTFGLVGLTKVLAFPNGAGCGVTANRTSPIVVLTELGRKAWPRSDPDLNPRLAEARQDGRHDWNAEIVPGSPKRVTLIAMAPSAPERRICCPDDRAN